VKPRVAVHKFSSCDGCQLAFINDGKVLLGVTSLVDLVHFAEAGPVDPYAKVDIAFVEGSVSTPHEFEMIKKIRENSDYLVTIGACATSGGLQALRNTANAEEWFKGVYAHPEYLDNLKTATPISDHVTVDLELWGCPVSPKQVVTAVRWLLSGVQPSFPHDSMCLECKRQGNVCVLVTQGMPCMGPVTKGGCGALCPSFGRACYSCFGPSENPNTTSFGNRLEGLGLMPDEVARRFMMIHSNTPEFAKAGKHFKGIPVVEESKEGGN